METLFPATIVALAAFGVTFAVDHLPKNWAAWTHVAASWLVSIGFASAAQLDVFANITGDGEASILGIVMTGFLLAGLASKGVHTLNKATE